jgi:hypothetical protein
MPPVVVVMVARIPADGVASFLGYEAAVLPLLADHGGRLERRLRGAGGGVEVHLVRFASAEAFAAYRADPRREAVRGLLEASGAAIEVLELAEASADELLRPPPGAMP